MATRTHKPTSKMGEAYIKPFKESHKQKILSALEKLRVGATQEEIAMCCGLRPDQVWKRMIDLQKDEKVFDTGITRRLKSGLPGIVWQMKGLRSVDPSNPKTDAEVKDLQNASIPVSEIQNWWDGYQAGQFDHPIAKSFTQSKMFE